VRTGKLPPQLLGRLLAGIPRPDPRVLLGSGVGEDAALIDFMTPPQHGGAPRAGAADARPGGARPAGAPSTGAAGLGADTGAGAGGSDRLLVAKTDPITFATDLIGWYAVHVNANDVACAGATPRWFMATALLPERWEESEVAALFEQLTEACTSLGVTLVGGHTEITGGLERPVLSGCMLGEVERARAVRTGGGQARDNLILTQGIAVEGTAILAREAAEALHARGVPGETVARARELLFHPGISVVPAARLLCHVAPPPEGVHSLHDPTEGGLAAGVWEIAEASQLGATIEAQAVSLLPESGAICAALGLDPYGLLASGALLAAVAPGATSEALRALTEAGIPARVVGRLTPREQGLWRVEANGERRPWPSFDRDELARYFAEAST
jgi:hydrogenase expression/formation protein HypE